MRTGSGEGGFDVLGGVTEVFRYDRAVIHLVERLAEAQRDAKGCATGICISWDSIRLILRQPKQSLNSPPTIFVAFSLVTSRIAPHSALPMGCL